MSKNSHFTVYQRDGSFGLWKDGVLYIYLASGNQKNRPFGLLFSPLSLKYTL